MKLFYTTGAHLLGQFYTYESYLCINVCINFICINHVFNVYIQPALCSTQMKHSLINSSLSPMAHLDAGYDHSSIGSHSQELVPPDGSLSRLSSPWKYIIKTGKLLYCVVFRVPQQGYRLMAELELKQLRNV